MDLILSCTIFKVISSPCFVFNVRNENVEVTDFISDHAALVFNLDLGHDSEQKNSCQAQRCD